MAGIKVSSTYGVMQAAIRVTIRRKYMQSGVIQFEAKGEQMVIVSL